MKNNKGFTLVELIAIITILAVISVMSFSAITRTIKNTELKKIQVFEDSIINAAETYVEGNITSFAVLDNQDNITVQLPASKLVEHGYLDRDIKNPTDYELAGVYILIERSDGVLRYRITYDPTDLVYDNLGESFKLYEDGYAIYYNPETGKKCTMEEADQNVNEVIKATAEIVNSDGTNTEIDSYSNSTGIKNGCMKWYTFNDDDQKATVDIMLNHNISNDIAWISLEDYFEKNGSSDDYEENGAKFGPLTLNKQLEIDTATWKNKARLITATEIAKITKADTTLNWKSDELGANNFYFLGLVIASEELENANYSDKTYNWLVDNTSCRKNSGLVCYNKNIDSSVDGYWTSSPVYSTSSGNRVSNSAWAISETTYKGALFKHGIEAYYSDDQYLGIRPVITIDKSILG